MADADIIYTIESTLLECVFDGIINAGLPEPCRVCVVPGEIAWDDCTRGQLAIALTEVYYSNTFPSDTSTDTTTSCAQGMAVASLTMSLLRCAPVPQSLAQLAPTCEALDLTARLIGEDSYVMRTSLACCLRDLKRDNTLLEYRIGSATVQGPEGGCVGNSITVLIGLARG